MASIVFLHPDKDYNGSSMHNKSSGSVGPTSIILAELFVSNGHDVEFITATKHTEIFNGVTWSNKPQKEIYDLAIANLYPAYFNLIKANKKALWIRNPLNKWRRYKKSIFHLLRHRPTGVFLSDQNLSVTPSYIPFSDRVVIEHGIHDIYLNRPEPRKAPKPVAIFASNSYRNLNIVIDEWIETIHPHIPNAELHLYCGFPKNYSDEVLRSNNIKHIGRVRMNDLIKVYNSARVLMYPGHIEETFCSVAHEATLCGLPLITMGIGSLVERVDNGINGYLTPTTSEMSQKTIQLLSDDNGWEKMNRSTLAYNKFYTWADRANVWENYFLSDL